MSEARPFFTVPGAVWRRDRPLNGCREDSIAIFKVIAEASDRDWRLEVAPGNHAFSVRQCILDPERFRRWSEERIDRALAELRARGCLLLATSNDREWLEIADRLTYCKGHKKSEPLRPPEQGSLPLGGEPVLFSLAPPHIPVRGESESEKKREDSESARATAPALSSPTTRAMSRGNDSGSNGKFARDESAFPGDAEWGLFCRVLARDMVTNGALWVLRWKENREACVTGLRDYQAQPPELKAESKPERYITSAFINATHRRAS